MRLRCRAAIVEALARASSQGGALVRLLLLLCVRLYQVSLSPLLGGRCRYEPSCSQYAVQALSLHGATRGAWLTACRVCRCHPFAASGYDPVPAPVTKDIR